MSAFDVEGVEGPRDRLQNPARFESAANPGAALMSMNGRDRLPERASAKSVPSRSAPAGNRGSTSIVDAAAAPPSEWPNIPM